MKYNNSKVVAIIQARLGSSRFPGKMLKELSGRPLIYWVVERVKRANSLDSIILATTDNGLDDKLVEYVSTLDVGIFRGSEEDVLKRFVDSIADSDAGVVVRICADNPLVDPDILDYAVNAFKNNHLDYMYNHIPKGGCEYPDGLGVEVIGRQVLEGIAEMATLKQHREHVTSYIWDHRQDFSIAHVDCPDKWSARGQPKKLDIDKPSDLELMQGYCKSLNINSTGIDILNVWRSENASV